MNKNVAEMIRSATLAANGHNTQPWKFSVKPTAIQIYPDLARRLRVVDPNDRELWISLGCALENLVIAANALGFETTITYPTSLNQYIQVQYKKTGELHADPLYDAISKRQSTRAVYNAKPIPDADLARIQSIPLEDGIMTHIFTSMNELDALLQFITAADQAQYKDSNFRRELAEWSRFNWTEALGSLDGLYASSFGNAQVPRWLGKVGLTALSARQQVKADVKNVESSAGLIVISSEQDSPPAWVQSGRVAERLALTLTCLGIKSAFLSQALEVEQVREQLQAYLQLDNAHPQMLVRFGYAERMPRSLRRPVDQVLV